MEVYYILYNKWVVILYNLYFVYSIAVFRVVSLVDNLEYVMKKLI